jgi:hypothetical protein
VRAWTPVRVTSSTIEILAEHAITPDAVLPFRLSLNLMAGLANVLQHVVVVLDAAADGTLDTCAIRNWLDKFRLLWAREGVRRRDFKGAVDENWDGSWDSMESEGSSPIPIPIQWVEWVSFTNALSNALGSRRH